MRKRMFFKKYILPLLLIILAFIYLLYSYIILKPTIGVVGSSEDFVGTYLLVNSLIIISIVLYLYLKKKATTKLIIILIFAFSIILHLFYILKTGVYLRQYDTLTNGVDPGVGHFGYAFSFYKSNSLPDYGTTIDTIYQFYHPPINAFIQGHFMRFFEAININASLENTPIKLFETTQILSVIYVFISSLFMVKTIKLLNLKNRTYIIAAAFVILFPRLTQFSGQLNNDVLSFMLQCIALYFSFKWYTKGKKRADILLTAFFIGLSMMVKMSGSVIVIGIGIIFITELINTIRKKDEFRSFKGLLIDYILFVLICVPLALWWQVYLNKVYLLPYNFVFDRLNSSLFVGTRDWVLENKPNSIAYYDINNSGSIYTNSNYNILVRFIFPVYFPDFQSGLYCDAFKNYNLLTYAIKSSIFGEFKYSFDYLSLKFAMSSIVLLFFNYFLFLIHIVINFIKNRSKTFYLSLMLFLGIALLYLYLSISMPFGCSMDFRYIVVIILPIIIIESISMNNVKESNKNLVMLSFVTECSIILFLTFSTLFYIFAL